MVKTVDKINLCYNAIKNIKYTNNMNSEERLKLNKVNKKLCQTFLHANFQRT